MARTQLFISYAREDEKWRRKVVSHLGLLSDLIVIWDDSNIGAGQRWLSRINRAMARARIALLLISVDFLNSDFIKKKELPELFRRHKSDGMTIYPLLVEYCAWTQVPWLKQLQIRPSGAKPVSDNGSTKRNKILSQVADEIAAIAMSAARKPRKSTQKKRAAKTTSVRRPRTAKKSAGKRASKARARVSTKRKPTRPTTRKRTTKRAKPK